MHKASDPHLALLEYRNTPLDGIDASPAELLMSRKLKSILPMHSSLLTPKVPENVPQQLQDRQKAQKFYYDRTAHDLPEFSEGEEVLFKDGKTWRPARIHKKLPFRSYIIEARNRTFYRRNRIHLRPNRGSTSHSEWEPPIEIPQPTTEIQLRNQITTTEIQPRNQITTTEIQPRNQRTTTEIQPRNQRATTETQPRNQRATSEIQPRNHRDDNYKTKSGRIVKPPSKLDL